MKNLFICLGLFILAGNASAAGDSCAIQAGFVSCIDYPAQYDNGCSVTCSDSQKAECVPASVVQIPDQWGRYGNCELFASACYCN